MGFPPAKWNLVLHSGYTCYSSVSFYLEYGCYWTLSRAPLHCHPPPSGNDLFFIYDCVCCVCGVHRDQKRTSDTQELDLHPMMWCWELCSGPLEERWSHLPLSHLFWPLFPLIFLKKLTITKIKRTKITANFINITLSSTVYKLWCKLFHVGLPISKGGRHLCVPFTGQDTVTRSCWAELWGHRANEAKPGFVPGSDFKSSTLDSIPTVPSPKQGSHHGFGNLLGSGLPGHVPCPCPPQRNLVLRRLPFYFGESAGKFQVLCSISMYDFVFWVQFHSLKIIKAFTFILNSVEPSSFIFTLHLKPGRNSSPSNPLFETESHTAQASLGLTMQLEMISNFWSSCLYLGAGIIGMCHYSLLNEDNSFLL